MSKNKLLKCLIIVVVFVLVGLFLVKSYCDKTFLCTIENLSVFVGEGASEETRVKVLDERSYTYCRFLEMKTQLNNGEYDSFIESFEVYYINSCIDDSRYASFKSVFCDYDDLSRKEAEVLLEAMEKAYNYDINNILERNHLIQDNLALQAEILYFTGHPIKAYEKKVSLENYIKEYREVAKGEYLK